MSNNTQRDELKSKVDSLVIYASIAAQDEELGAVTDNIMADIDQYTQRLVLEGQLAEYRRALVPGYFHWNSDDGEHNMTVKERIAELQSQLDKLNGEKS